jgi:hypothetical protein
MFDAERVHCSQSIITRKIIKQPGLPDETILPTHFANVDTVAVIINPETKTHRWLPKNYPGTFKVTDKNEQGFVFKHDIVFSAFGDTIGLVSILQDEKMPEGEIMKLKAKGWGPHPDFMGHIWVVPPKHGMQYVEQSFKQVFMPAFDRYTEDTRPRSADVTEARVYAMDGALAQTSVFTSDEMKTYCKGKRCSVLKHHTCCSLWYQLNDTACTHRSAHRFAKSGTLADLFDERVLDSYCARFESEVKRIQNAHPQPKGKWQPSSNTWSRISRGVTILQPVWREVLSNTRQIREGATKAGFIIKSARVGIKVNEKVLLSKFPKLSEKTPSEMKAYKKILTAIEQKVNADASLCEVPEKLMTAEGLFVMPDLKKLLANPQKSQPEDRPACRRRCMITTLWNEQQHQTEKLNRKTAREEAAKKEAADKKQKKAAATAERKRLREIESTKKRAMKQKQRHEDKIKKQAIKKKKQEQEKKRKQEEKIRDQERKAREKEQNQKEKARTKRENKRQKLRPKYEEAKTRSTELKQKGELNERDCLCHECGVLWDQLEEYGVVGIEWRMCDTCGNGWCGYCMEEVAMNDHVGVLLVLGQSARVIHQNW